MEDNIGRIDMPENLSIGLMVAKQRKKCRSLDCRCNYYGFAFGQSPFPAPPSLVNELKLAAGKTGYVDAQGIYELRSAVSGFNARHFGLKPDPEKIVIGPGTKGLLFLLFSIIKGGIIIPTPSWIGYSPQASFLNKQYFPLATFPENNYKLTAKQLEDFLSSRKGRQHMLVLNNPNNPTGQIYTKDELTSIAGVCRKYNTLVLADEIYALTSFDITDFTSMGKVFPEGTFVLNGLSKDRSAGGYRLGVCHLPDTDCKTIAESLQKLAATIYTNITTPVQLAAVSAYRENEEVERYFATTRQIHRIMGATISEKFSSIEGLKVTMPSGGFYFYVDFNNLKTSLKECGINNSNQLGKALLSHPRHIATVTGDSLLLDPDNFGVRIAYVDYDGKKAYDAYLNNRPLGRQDEIRYVKKHAPMMIEGAEAVSDFVNSIKSGSLIINQEDL